MRGVKKLQNLEQRLQDTEQQLQVLQKVSRVMTRKWNLSEVLQAIVELVTESTHCDSCLIYLKEGDDLVLCASDAPHPGEIGRIRLKMGEGITGWVAREQRMVAIPQGASRDSRFRMFTELPEDAFDAFLSVPVITREEVVGVINVQHRNSHRHSGSELEMMRTVGEQVGCAILLAEMDSIPNSDLKPVEAIVSAVPRRRSLK